MVDTYHLDTLHQLRVSAGSKNGKRFSVHRLDGAVVGSGRVLSDKVVADKWSCSTVSLADVQAALSADSKPKGPDDISTVPAPPVGHEDAEPAYESFDEEDAVCDGSVNGDDDVTPVEVPWHEGPSCA